jgi:hypothetical protein
MYVYNMMNEILLYTGSMIVTVREIVHKFYLFIYFSSPAPADLWLPSQ